MGLFGSNDQADSANQLNDFLRFLTEKQGYGGWNFGSQFQKPSDWTGLINNVYNTGQSNLYGAGQRAAGESGQYAGALASSQGYSDPTALMMRARTNALSQFAPQYGQLEQARAGQLLQAPMYARDMYQKNFENLMNLLHARMGATSQLPQGGGIGGLLGTLTGAAGQYGLGSLFGAFGGGAGAGATGSGIAVGLSPFAGAL